MTLNELAAATGLTASDLIGIWDAEASGSTEPTQKLTAQQLANAVKGLANLVGTAELAAKQDRLTFDSTPTTGSTNPVTSGGIANAISSAVSPGNRANSAISRLDATDITTFADTVEVGKIQFFRNRSQQPTSSWNYSPGIILRETTMETVVVLFGLRVNSIAMLRKDGGTWASTWAIIS